MIRHIHYIHLMWRRMNHLNRLQTIIFKFRMFQIYKNFFLKKHPLNKL